MSWDRNRALHALAALALVAPGLAGCATDRDAQARAEAAAAAAESARAQASESEAAARAQAAAEAEAATATASEGRMGGRVRTGAVRGAPPGMVVVRGSPDALKWYPMAREVAVGARICLPKDAKFVTFERLDGGGRVTYTGTTGDGCNQKIPEPAGSADRTGGGNGF